ncbi:MAG: ferrous iron transport protein A [Syntrophobacterales bacterium]|nr:ferrous iron transport protein A [Syntrophobacterales bacterium]
MVLSNLKPEDQARIVAVEGGRGIRQKLLLRGISEGSTVRVVSSDGGPVVVELDGGMIAIGEGMAQRIRVQRIAVS